MTPHVAQNTSNRRSAIDGRTTRHPGYAVSQRIRKRIEEAFGWIKEVALQRRARHRGKARVGWQFTLAAAAYNLIRLPKLLLCRTSSAASSRPAVSLPPRLTASGSSATIGSPGMTMRISRAAPIGFLPLRPPQAAIAVRVTLPVTSSLALSR